MRRGETPQSLRRLLQGDLASVALRAVSRRPEDRYGSALELVADIERYLDDQPVVARSLSTTYVLRKLVARYRGRAVAVAVSLGALVLGSVGATVGLIKARAAEQRAHAEARAALEARDETREINQFLTSIFRASGVAGRDADRPPSEITAPELLERGAERIEKELHDRPVLAAHLRQTIGQVYRQLGLYDEAHRHLEAARNSLKGVPSKAENLAYISKELAQVKLRQGEAQEARSLLDHARVVAGAIEDETARNSFQAGVHDLSGRLYRRAGAFEAAERDHQEAVRLFESLPDPDVMDVIASRSNLGALYFAQDRWREAEAQFRTALELCREHLPPGHSRTALMLSNLGGSLGNQERNDEARPLLEEALLIQRRMLGDAHPMIANSLNNLGVLAADLGNLQLAERYHLEALEIRRSTLGDDHPRHRLESGQSRQGASRPRRSRPG